MNKNILAVSLFILAAVSFAYAQEEQKKSLTPSFSAGATVTDGNSETLQANAAVKIEGEKEKLGSFLAGIEANYGESTIKTGSEGENNGEDEETKKKTLDNARAFANAKKTITPMTFGYLDGSVLYDNIAEIDYRASAGPGLGAYLMKNATSALSVEAGPSYIWEKISDIRDDFLSLRTAERFDHMIGKHAKVWQALECLFKVDDFGNYFLTAEAGAEAAMTERLNLRIVLQCRYDSTPGEGLEKRDLSLITGVSFSL